MTDNTDLLKFLAGAYPELFDRLDDPKIRQAYERIRHAMTCRTMWRGAEALRGRLATALDGFSDRDEIAEAIGLLAQVMSPAWIEAQGGRGEAAAA